MHPNSNQISCSPASPLDAGLVLLLLRCGSGAAGAVPGQKTPGKASWVGSGCRVAGCWEHLEVLSWGKKGLGAGALGCTSQIHPACGQGWQVHNPKECSQGGPGTGFHPNPGERSHPKGCWQQGTVPTAGKAAPEEQLKCLETRNPSGCWTSSTRLKLPAGWGQDPSLVQKQLARGAGDPKVSNRVLRAVPAMQISPSSGRRSRMPGHVRVPSPDKRVRITKIRAARCSENFHGLTLTEAAN